MSASLNIFQSNNVTVSRTLVRVGSISYPINGISSVFVQKSGSAGAYFIAFFLISLGLLIAVSSKSNKDSLSLGIFLLITAAVMIAIAMSLLSTLVLKTASGDQQVLKARDKNHLFNVKRAIEEAVAQRG